MNYRITNGAITYGADTILEEINFEIKGTQKIAIVGRNGSGKSTLLKSIINNDMLSEGIGTEKFNIYKEGNPQIGYLKQIDFEDDSLTMLEEILKVYKTITDLENKIAELVVKMQTDKSEQMAQEYLRLQERYELLDGYTYKKEYETAINKFGFSKEDKSKKLSEFSGGQRTKIAFIKLLLSKPDILLLDEPTNHLDITTIEWLEGYLKNYSKAVVIVSHDRMFLNKIVNKVYEIEYGAITEYTGNYDFFEKQKRVNYEKQLKDYEYQQKEIKRLTDIADRFRYKPTKAKMALSKLKQVERMVKVEEPNKYDTKTFKTGFKLEKESGTNVVTIERLEIGYSDKIIEDITLKIYKGQKLAIIGSNGTGKSTLLKTIVGKIKQIGGEIEFGHNVKIGYFDQQIAQLNLDKTVFDEFKDEFPQLTVTEARNNLASFMFVGEDVFKQVNMLSGGEKVRLQLCKILKSGPNLLILDEPTNHMDIIGKETLENLLKEYEGTLIFVSHDRYFVNKIADSIFVIENGKSKFYNCNYEEYLRKRNLEEELHPIKLEKIEVAKKQLNHSPLKEKSKLEKRTAKVEDLISQKEKIIKDLQNELTKEEIYTDYIKVKEIQDNINIINFEIESYMQEWEELQQKLNDLDI
ncbi:MAG: ABC-F family ATP-binding cassette domain-containing protein [Clostridia bacterium]|nr:ABC-F family ATP-binding cassette domain-containing protein [Clostridia bacterium]